MKRFETILLIALLLVGTFRLAAASQGNTTPSVQVEEVSMLDRGEPKTYVGTVEA